MPEMAEYFLSIVRDLLKYFNKLPVSALLPLIPYNKKTPYSESTFLSDAWHERYVKNLNKGDTKLLCTMV